MTTEKNTIFIGKRIMPNYELKARDLLDAGAKEITIKSRGMMNGKAIDLAEILKRKCNLKIARVNTETEEVDAESREEKTSYKKKITSLEITMTV